ncbi:MAG: GAF domain-containing protein, partial [Cyclobacteriaceae bacterium]|nr:GAF domain-containing protein [Cyclobacteriaceae bacterium]
MAESIFLPSQASKEERYQALLPQIEALISHESDLYANLANTVAAL